LWLGLWGIASGNVATLKRWRFYCRYARNVWGEVPDYDEGCMGMDKKELIERICEINKSAKPEFLAKFSEQELNAYLQHLAEPDLAELSVSS
jgi:hypothetical protein